MDAQNNTPEARRQKAFVQHTTTPTKRLSQTQAGSTMDDSILCQPFFLPSGTDAAAPLTPQSSVVDTPQPSSTTVSRSLHPSFFYDTPTTHTTSAPIQQPAFSPFFPPPDISPSSAAESRFFPPPSQDQSLLQPAPTQPQQQPPISRGTTTDVNEAQPQQPVSAHLQLLSNFPLPVFDLTPTRLSDLAAHILAESFNAQGPLLQAFASSVVLEAHAAHLPYHNARTAVLHLHFCWHLLKSCAAAQQMSPTQRLATLLAAFCAHINHPGVDSAALEAIKSHPLVTRYAAASALKCHDRRGSHPTILQHHHCAVAVALLGSPSHNLLRSIPDSKLLREEMCAILCKVDDCQHYSLLADATGDLQSSSLSDHLLSCLVVRCSLLARFFLPWDTCKHCSLLFAQEQQMQADLLAAQHTTGGVPSSVQQPSSTFDPAQELMLLNTHAAPASQVLAQVLGTAGAGALKQLFKNLDSNRSVLQALLA